MKQQHVFARLALLVALVCSTVLSGVGGRHAAAQSGDQRYQSPTTGAVIQTTGPWTIDTESIESSPEMELILLYGQYDGMVVSFLPAGTDLVMARDIFLQEFASVFEGFVPIDRGAYGNVSYSLDITTSEGIEFGVFSLFLGQRASGYVEYYLYFGPVLYFEQGFASAQQNVNVNGNAVFEGVDGGGLQDLLAANAGAAGGSTELPDENVIADEEVPTEAPAAPPAAPTEASEAPPTEAPAAPPAGTSADGTAYLGQIEAELVYLQTTLTDFAVNFGKLEDDTSGVAVEELNRISAEWVSYPERAAAIVAPAGFEDIDASYQALATEIEALGNNWYGVVETIQGGDQAAVGVALGEFFDMLIATQGQIDDLSAEIATGDTSAEGAAPTVEPTIGATFEVVEETPEATEESTEEATDLTGQGDSGDRPTRSGASLPDPDSDDEAAAVKNESETGRGAQGVDLSDFEELGLVAEGEYVSPQHDVQITWEETWGFALGFDEPIASDVESGFDSLTISWNGDGGASMFVTVAGNEDEVVPEDIAEYWATDEYVAEAVGEGGEVLLFDTNRSGAAAVLIRGSLDDGTEVIVLREATCADAGCNALAMSMMVGSPETFADAYVDARGDIRVDGERLVGVFTARELETALAE